MTRRSTTTTLTLSALVLLVFIHTSSVASQSNQTPPFSSVINDVLRAESSGARPEELRGLIERLNSILSLQDQLNKPQNVNRQSQLQEGINNASIAVDSEANQLQILASHRTFTAHIIAYSAATVGALIATVVCHYVVLLWRRSKVKRALQLRIVPRE